jgi:cytidylate kinase
MAGSVETVEQLLGQALADRFEAGAYLARMGQRDMARNYNVIMDGRDIGTVVLPKADVKMFLTATPEVRAQRRLDELVAKGQKANFQQVLKDIQQRDYQDTHREIAPLKMAKDSVKVDTSELDIEGVIAAIKEIIGKKIPL